MSEQQARTREITLAMRRVTRASREMHAALARRLGLRVTDVQAIDHVVSAGEPIGPVALAERLGMRSASATVLVDRLVAAGHLERHADRADGRRLALRATDRAGDEVRDALAPLVDDITAIVERLDPAQAATVLAFLREATDAMHAYAAREDGPRASG